MPFELIMLLGFFGAVLLSLLPTAPARVADESFRGPQPRRAAAKLHRSARQRRGTGGLKGPDEAVRVRAGSRAAA